MADEKTKKSVVSDLPEERKWVITLLVSFLNELTENQKITPAQRADIALYLLHKT